MKRVFAFCSPCCNNCPTVYRDGRNIVITDPDDIKRGHVTLPLETFRALLLDEAVGTFDPERLPASKSPKFSRDGVFVATGWNSAQGNIVLLFRRATFVTFLAREWNALFSSMDARRSAVAAVDAGDDVPVSAG